MHSEHTGNDIHDGGESPSRKKLASPQSAPVQMLKLSCDVCAKLKIRCPKQQPSCDRCLSKGLRCVYSSARRYGKRKRDEKEKEKEENHVSRFFLPRPQTPLSVLYQNTGSIGDLNDGNLYHRQSSSVSGTNLLPTPPIDSRFIPALPTPVDVFPPTATASSSLQPLQNDALLNVETIKSDDLADAGPETPRSIQASQ